MAAHEELTVRRWRQFVREVSEQVLPSLNGLLVKSLGDGLLCVFPSGPSAIAAARAMHDIAHRLNGACPADAAIQLRIGAHNVFREFVTVHRGTAGGGGVTAIGDHNLFMAYAHVAHDCHIGNWTIFGNGATMGGHVAVEDYATISAYSLRISRASARTYRSCDP